MGSTAEIALFASFVADLTSAAGQADVLQAVAKWLPKMIEAERISMALPADPKNMVIHTLRGQPELDGDGEASIERTLAGEGFAKQEIVNLADLNEVELAEEPYLGLAGFRSALIVPILSGDRCLGTFNLVDSRPGLFAVDHVTMLRTIAEVTASFLVVHQLIEDQTSRADIDLLTEARSRMAILHALDEAFQDGDERPSVLCLDAVGFKIINETHGHSVGDEFLIEIVKRIVSVTRGEDAIGRLGGDEFLVVVPRDRTGNVARALAERIVASVAEPIVVQGLVLTAELSIAVASVESLDSSARDLLREADQAKCSAKTAGSAVVVTDATTRLLLAAHAAVDHEIDDAMANGALTLHFQPVCDIHEFRMVGAEALLRWKHPEHGWMPAPTVVERIQSTGRTEAFTRWSIAQVIRSWATFRSHLPSFHNKSVSINLTPQQLSWPGLADFFLASLHDAGFRPQDVIVEVVESAEILPGAAAELMLKKIGEAGGIIALDDFGTGHNSLGYFTQFPIRTIKFDRSLVGAMVQNEQARLILKGLATMAADLGVFTIAEGIETEPELHLCRQAMISHGQGWYLGYPAPIEDLVEIVKGGNLLGQKAHVQQ